MKYHKIISNLAPLARLALLIGAFVYNSKGMTQEAVGILIVFMALSPSLDWRG